MALDLQYSEFFLSNTFWYALVLHTAYTGSLDNLLDAGAGYPTSTGQQQINVTDTSTRTSRLLIY